MAPGSTTPTPETTSIGQTLKSMREAKGISQVDIASKMHLDPRFIVAIEEDNFDSLPDVIYVRGYIRSYSKLVGANADALVKQFEAHGGNFEPEIIPEIRHSSQTSGSDKPVKAFTYLVVFALMILLFAWWQSNYMMETPSFLSGQKVTPAAPVDVTTTTPAPPVQPSSQYEPVVSNDPAQTGNPSSIYTPAAELNNYNQQLNVGTPSASTLPATGTNGEYPAAQPPAGTLPSTISETSTAFNAGVPGTVPQVMAPLSPTSTVGTAPMTDSTVQPAPVSPVTPPTAGTEMSATAAANPAAMGQTAQPPVMQTTGPDQIVLKLTADSWIEIIDSTGAKVFFNLGRSGDVFNVRGTAPFDVLLGFSQAVTLEYNGKPFDAAPYSRAGVARFMLGE
jgi:cytoskeleton protein RodZ